MKIHHSFASLLMAVILISGCVPAFDVPKRVRVIQLVPQPAKTNAKAEIFLLRYDEWAQHFVNYIISQNQTTIGLIVPGSYLHWETSPGHVTISYRASIAPRCYKIARECLTRENTSLDVDSKYPLKTFTFIAEEDKTYYLHFAPDWFLLTDVPRNVDISIIKKTDLSGLKSPRLINAKQQ